MLQTLFWLFQCSKNPQCTLKTYRVLYNENFEFLLIQTWFCKTSFLKSSFGFPNLNFQNLHYLAHTYPIKKVLFALHHTVRSELVPFSHQLAFDFLFVKIMIWLTLFLPLTPTMVHWEKVSSGHNSKFLVILSPHEPNILFVRHIMKSKFLNIQGLL